MSSLDLNLLTALDILLTEGSVGGAARRLNLSASAMSRTLTRIREAAGDPILVRAGRNLVPTPRAQELRERVREIVEAAQAVLRADAPLDLAGLERIFIIRANDGFVEVFGGRLIQRVAAAAPGARLHFAPKPDKDVRALREGRIDIDVGVVSETGPEIRIQTLFRDRFVGAVRAGHPLTQGAITPERYAACQHISVSRRGRCEGPIDDALQRLGLAREVVTVVASFPAALAIARTSDLVANVSERHTAPSRNGMYTFPLPVTTGDITISQSWHPRNDADPAHRWLRSCLREVCA
ncbi:MAG: LysR family transcriptional regulator [Alphaproteobacteria bacterium]|nr:LysR family transcriptional regulator [Alphaproteobacteria bacterium]